MPDLVSKNTALMIFSLSAQAEGRRKRLLGRRRSDGNRILQFLISQTSQIAQASNVEVVWVDEKKQKGQDFGQRFTNAFVDLFAQGYEKVISIGNDCPDLSPGILEEALVRLQQNNLVLGPALDGGEYLIGIHRDDFVASDFEDLPWNTAELHEAFLHLAKASKTQVYCLTTLADIDDQRALWHYLKCFSETAFARFLNKIIQKKTTRPTTPTEGFREIHLLANQPLRAPPFFH